MLSLFRISAFLYQMHIPVVPRIIQILNRVVFAVALPPSVTMGKRVIFAYQGLGTVVHARAVIGSNVYIGPHVTIGGRSKHHNVPIVQDNVFIGAGALVLGPITIGVGATIAAGAVVIRDVPPGKTVAGNPAKEIRLSAESTAVSAAVLEP
jgi:serine O-acetyltransferase